MGKASGPRARRFMVIKPFASATICHTNYQLLSGPCRVSVVSPLSTYVPALVNERISWRFDSIDSRGTLIVLSRECCGPRFRAVSPKQYASKQASDLEREATRSIDRE